MPLSRYKSPSPRKQPRDPSRQYSTRYSTQTEFLLPTGPEFCEPPPTLPQNEVEFVTWLFDYVPELEKKGFKPIVAFDSKEEAGFFQTEGSYPSFHNIPLKFSKGINWLDEDEGELYSKVDGLTQEQVETLIEELPVEIVTNNLGRIDGASVDDMLEEKVPERYRLKPFKFLNYKIHSSIISWLMKRGTYFTDFHAESNGDASIAKMMSGSEKIWLFSVYSLSKKSGRTSSELARVLSLLLNYKKGDCQKVYYTITRPGESIHFPELALHLVATRTTHPNEISSTCGLGYTPKVQCTLKDSSIINDVK